ncbi:hypothetical protein Pelo_4418 [Pelomyxa schiedti]|nr:hypothetical protein Pelo_4418 [Pelomyxa schiedti]
MPATAVECGREKRRRVERVFQRNPLELLDDGADVNTIVRLCELSHGYAWSLWKAYHTEGRDAAAEKLHKSFSHSFKPNSKNSKVCQFLQENCCGKLLGGPKSLSYVATACLHQPITSKDISKGISVLHLSSKVKSPTPGFSVAEERHRFHVQLQYLVWDAAQIVFTDEKAFKPREITKRIGERGYAPVGVRLPTTARMISFPAPMFGEVEVIAAIGVVAPDLMGNGSLGDIGTISFSLREGRLEKEEKIAFYTKALPPCLSTHPGPHSVVVLDNMPQHRQQEVEITSAINAAGAFIAWNPPQSPDLNLIEKFWDVVLHQVTQHHLELVSGMHGTPWSAMLEDLVYCLQKTRLSRHSLQGVGLTWL